ncbi:MAG TPA: hypothetical protein VFC51_16685 [Chloroflexota bacterium]|nr:hypothetical protein [Chloroflexota bacterium]
MRDLRANLLAARLDLVVLTLAGVVFLVFWLVDFSGEPRRQLIAGAIAVAILALVVAAFVAARRSEPASGDPRFIASRRFTLLVGAGAVALFFIVRFSAVTALAYWSEEIGWAEIARRIVEGARWDPFLAKSDYPSSFQAFPLALLVAVGVPTVLASKIIAGVYFAISVYFFGRLARELLPDRPGWFEIVFPLVLAAFSTVSWFIVMTGWHEITHVNLIIFACWYYGLRLIKYQERSAAIALGLWSGLALWTLYTPAVFAIPMGLIVLAGIAGPVGLPRKLTFVSWGGLVTAPVIGLALSSHGGILNRHAAFYLRGGEWAGSTWSAERNPLHTYLLSTVQLVKDTAPVFGRLDWEAAQRPHLEPLVFALAAVGMVAILLSRRRLLIGGVLLPVLGMVAGLVLSNPTPWRESCITAGALVLAVVGFGALWPLVNRNVAVSGAVAALVIIFQLATFVRTSSYLEAFQNIPLFASGKAAAASVAFAKQWLTTSPSKQILVQDDLWGRFVAVDLPASAQVRRVQSGNDIKPDVCRPSCLLLGYDVQGTPAKESDYESGLAKLSLKTTKSVVFSEPGQEGYAIVAGEGQQATRSP